MIRWPTWLSWPQWVGEERRAQQRQVMAVGTVLLSINAVVFNLLPNPGYDAPLLFVVAGLFLLVLGLAKYERLYYAVVNFCLLLLLAMLGHFGLQTGGIQSSNMVWLCILSVPAMFFLGPRGGIIYLLVILALIGSIFAVNASTLWLTNFFFFTRLATGLC
jgi:hypothetical protein